MSRSEKAIFWIVFALLFGVLAWWKCLTWVEGWGDNVFTVDLSETIAHRGVPLTSVQASISQALPTWFMKADEFCGLPLHRPPEREFNYFRWHPYVILYLLAPLVWLFSSKYAISAMIALSFMGILAIAYWLLRQRGVGPWFAVAFCGLVMANPGWYLSLQGQIYVDRLFLLPGMLLVAALFAPKSQMKWVLLFGMLSLLITERTGIICGAFLFGAAILYWKKFAPVRVRIILIGLGCFLYSFMWIKFYIHYDATDTFISNFYWSVIKLHLSTPAFVEGIVVLLIVNFAFLGLFSIFEWRGLLLALGVMLPNILGNIGGAEKTGWFTHYHTMYFPFLIWASLEGYSKIYHFSRKRIAQCALLAGTLAVILASAALIPANSYKALKFSTRNYKKNPLYIAARDIPAFFGDHPTRPRDKETVRLIKQNIPRGSVVGTFEAMMPPLFGYVDLMYYPDGLMDSDYVVIPVEKDGSGKYRYSGQICYSTPDECAKISDCLADRLRSAGFSADSPLLLGTSRLAVLKRENKSSLQGSSQR